MSEFVRLSGLLTTINLESDALRAFKRSIDDFYSVPANVKSLALWTEKGAARHAKMLSTDKAPDVVGSFTPGGFFSRR